MNERCPFKVGDRVVYTPSQRGYDLDANFDFPARLVRGRGYTVVEIQRGQYIVVEGYDHPAGGIHWTEFSADKSN